ncbi:MAG: DUF4123 domain-containing protein [Flavobacteriales bacterium]|nr:DUF4123 domain-containing protein [Flavobacteriales bacterium]
MSNTFTLYDAASLHGSIHQAKEHCSEHQCLYIGDSETVLGHVAPWLFDASHSPGFKRWVGEEAPGKNWGIIVQSHATLEELHHHFRQFLMVTTEEGKELYFRFYDPRVLRVFLPTCDAEQLQEFFGIDLVDAFVMEDEAGNMIRFTLDGGALYKQELGMDLKGFLAVREKELAETIANTERVACAPANSPA